MSLFTGAAIIGAALAAGTATTVAAHEAASGAEGAANINASAAQQALDFTKAQKAKQEAAYAPYAAVGQQAISQLPGAVRPMPTQGPPGAYAGPPPLAYMGQGGRPGPATYAPPQNAPLSQIGAPMAGGTTAPGGTMVLLQAPDGSQRSVPQAQAQAYIAKGARVIG